MHHVVLPLIVDGQSLETTHLGKVQGGLGRIIGPQLHLLQRQEGKVDGGAPLVVRGQLAHLEALEDVLLAIHNDAVLGVLPKNFNALPAQVQQELILREKVRARRGQSDVIKAHKAQVGQVRCPVRLESAQVAGLEAQGVQVAQHSQGTNDVVALEALIKEVQRRRVKVLQGQRLELW